jgi:hypothetical protein
MYPRKLGDFLTYKRAGYALSYSLAHLAVPYGGRQEARLEPKYIQLSAPLALGST